MIPKYTDCRAVENPKEFNFASGKLEVSCLISLKELKTL